MKGRIRGNGLRFCQGRVGGILEKSLLERAVQLEFPSLEGGVELPWGCGTWEWLDSKPGNGSWEWLDSRMVGLPFWEWLEFHPGNGWTLNLGMVGFQSWEWILGMVGLPWWEWLEFHPGNGSWEWLDSILGMDPGNGWTPFWEWLEFHPGNGSWEWLDSIPGMVGIPPWEWLEFHPGNGSWEWLDSHGGNGWNSTLGTDPGNGWTPFWEWLEFHPGNGWNSTLGMDPGNGWTPFREWLEFHPGNGWTPTLGMDPGNGWTPIPDELPNLTHPTFPLPFPPNSIFPGYFTLPGIPNPPPQSIPSPERRILVGFSQENTPIPSNPPMDLFPHGIPAPPTSQGKEGGEIKGIFSSQRLPEATLGLIQEKRGRSRKKRESGSSGISRSLSHNFIPWSPFQAQPRHSRWEFQFGNRNFDSPALKNSH
ncbi:hypothetical protein WISP_08982 [Willisornis vidua]|uniref:Uncharacterized protein n=1 Tax=Willisornis vidua TaxID=1566151 RepID=A0ABQ9DWD0_9PASS|nr:hypothetical protein WISP_08982 [Willisornis vidua]